MNTHPWHQSVRAKLALNNKFLVGDTTYGGEGCHDGDSPGVKVNDDGYGDTNELTLNAILDVECFQGLEGDPPIVHENGDGNKEINGGVNEKDDRASNDNALVSGSVWSHHSNSEEGIEHKIINFNVFATIKFEFLSSVFNMYQYMTTIIVYSGGIKGLQINCAEDGKVGRKYCRCSLHIIARRVKGNQTNNLAKVVSICLEHSEDCKVNTGGGVNCRKRSNLSIESNCLKSPSCATPNSLRVITKWRNIKMVKEDIKKKAQDDIMRAQEDMKRAQEDIKNKAQEDMKRAQEDMKRAQEARLRLRAQVSTSLISGVRLNNLQNITDDREVCKLLDRWDEEDKKRKTFRRTSSSYSCRNDVVASSSPLSPQLRAVKERSFSFITCQQSIARPESPEEIYEPSALVESSISARPIYRRREFELSDDDGDDDFEVRYDGN